VDCQCSSCFPLVQSLITPLATFAHIPSAGSGPLCGCEEPCLGNWSAILFHQFPCVPAPIPVGSCYVLPISPGIDGSPRLIWNVSGSCQGPWWLPDFRKTIDVPTCVALFYTVHYTSLNGIYFSLECCGVEPKTEAVPPSRAPSIHPSTSAFIGLGPICVLDQAPFVAWVEPVLPFIIVRDKQTWMGGCGM
jgi:hypothetical protein